MLAKKITNLTKIKEINVKGIITKSNLPDADYVINPYIGCEHGCLYCYAEFMKRFTNHQEDWGCFVDVKNNAPKLIGNLKKYKNKNILFGSVTDAYQPVEGKYKITRNILKSLKTVEANVEILTKSGLVVRDIDIFKQFQDITIGVSLGILDNKTSSDLEPLASPPILRLAALKKCKTANLKTYIFISPIFPGITNVKEIIEKTKNDVDYFMFENLNLRASNKKRIFSYIEEKFPKLLPLYNEIYNQKDITYWDNLENEIKELGKKIGKECRIYFHHGGFKKKK